MYHIKDFKIVRRKIDGQEEKSLAFQQVFKNDEPPNKDDEVINRIKALEIDNAKIKQQLLEIIKVINNA